jgi:hypothetical protein
MGIHHSTGSLLVAALMAGCASQGSPHGGRPAPTFEDAGFESGVPAASPLDGWYSDDQAAGRIRFEADGAERVEGRRSLRVEIVEPRPSEGGMASVSQVVALPPGLASEPTFDLCLALRASSMSSVRIEVYVWDPASRAQSVAELTLDPPGETWTRPRLRFQVPSGHDQVGIFVYFTGEAGGRIWLDDAALVAAG